MRDTVRREEANIGNQLNEYGMPVFETPERRERSKQEIALEKAYWSGIQRAATIFISYGSTPERAVQMRIEADKHLANLKRELEGNNT